MSARWWKRSRRPTTKSCYDLPAARAASQRRRRGWSAGSRRRRTRSAGTSTSYAGVDVSTAVRPVARIAAKQAHRVSARDQATPRNIARAVLEAPISVNPPSSEGPTATSASSSNSKASRIWASGWVGASLPTISAFAYPEESRSAKQLRILSPRSAPRCLRNLDVPTSISKSGQQRSQYRYEWNRASVAMRSQTARTHSAWNSAAPSAPNVPASRVLALPGTGAFANKASAAGLGVGISTQCYTLASRQRDPALECRRMQPLRGGTSRLGQSTGSCRSS